MIKCLGCGKVLSEELEYYEELTAMYAMAESFYIKEDTAKLLFRDAEALDNNGKLYDLTKVNKYTQ